MFKKGEYVVYGTSGVCQVQEIGTLDGIVANKDKLYYTLIMEYSQGGKIFTPVENPKVMIRKILSKEEVRALLEQIPEVDEFVITNEKEREHLYKEGIKCCDCKELIKILKTIESRKKVRIANGKKMDSIDERYYKRAEELLYEELMISLQMDRNGVKKLLQQHLL